ncbi:MAG: 3-dehydroquinate synthase [Pseudomonadota bacterium]
MKQPNAAVVTSVELGERHYDIHIGADLLSRAGEALLPILSRPRAVVVTDENVAKAQGAQLKAGLQKAGVAFEFITLPPGEATKSFAQLEALLSRLLELGVERNDLIVAFGGGVIGDLVGFAAAILRRGCRFAQIPTTLLAQVDSAVGGKTAINTVQGKNLVGAFHQPSLVLADISALDTLPLRELRAGYAEVVKYGAIADADFFDWLEENGASVLSGDCDARIKAVKTSCEMKAAIVRKDEREAGERALLNLGHTFGHAFEAFYEYSDALLHGEAVALGIALAFEYSTRTGFAEETAAERMKRHLTSHGLPTSIADLPKKQGLTADLLITLMMQDKKVEAGALTLILINAIGSARIVKDADVDDVKTFLQDRLTEASRS